MERNREAERLMPRTMTQHYASKGTFWQRFWFGHVVFINDKGRQEVRGRYFYALAALIYLGGNWVVATHLAK